MKTGAVLGVMCASLIAIPTIPMAFSQTEENTSAEQVEEETISQESVDQMLSVIPYQEEGFETFEEWYAMLLETREGYTSLANQLVTDYSGYLSEEETAEINSLNEQLQSVKSITELNSISEQINNWQTTLQEREAAVIAKAQAAAEAEAAAQSSQSTSYSSGTSNSTSTTSYTSNGSGLTKSGGTNMYNGVKETYYNLDMSGVVSNAQSMGISGDYWVRDDGVKMYGDYVIVASQAEQGTIVDTSLGTGIVLDYCPAGTNDIATNW